MPVSAMRSHIRAESVVIPRHVVALLARELTNLSNRKIGMVLGHRDHSTINHSIRSIMSKIAADPNLAAKVERLRNKLLEREEPDNEIRQHRCEIEAGDHDRV
jgi:chromosomal replication initiator protein